MLLRNIFFEDEIKYYKDTAESLINIFLSSNIPFDQAVNLSSEVLKNLVKQIKMGIPIDEIISALDKNNFYRNVLDEVKKFTNPELDSEKYIQAKLARCEKNLHDSNRLTHLLSSLTNLFLAAKNKFTYLETHAVELEKLEEKDMHKDWMGNTRLLLAIKRQEIDLALKLISKKLFINESNIDGMTPLIKAAELGLDIVVNKLLEQNPALDKTSSEVDPFHVALFFAIHNKHQSTATLLYQAGARTDIDMGSYLIPKKNNYTLANYAMEKGIKLAVQLRPEQSGFQCSI